MARKPTHIPKHITGSRLSQYRAMGVDRLLYAAAGEIEFRGDIARGVHCLPDEDLVDGYGALCLAAGADPNRMIAHGDDPTGLVAPIKVPLVLAAVEAIEAAFGTSIGEWSDQLEAARVCAGFRFIADKICIVAA